MSYEKQTWTNNISTVDEQKMNHIEDGIEQNSNEIERVEEKFDEKNIVTAGLVNNVTLATTGEQELTLNTFKGKVGTRLTLSNGSIVIGAGISMVLVSAMVYANRSSSAGGACNVIIKRNGTAVAQSINSVPSGSGNQSIVVPPVLLSVEEGTTITLACYGYSGDIISSSVGTHLTVQVVK